MLVTLGVPVVEITSQLLALGRVIEFDVTVTRGQAESTPTLLAITTLSMTFGVYEIGVGEASKPFPEILTLLMFPLLGVVKEIPTVALISLPPTTHEYPPGFVFSTIPLAKIPVPSCPIWFPFKIT